MGDLGVDTAVEDLGDGRFRATLSREWEIWGPMGGYVAACALRAAGAATQHSRPATFSCHFLSVAKFGPIDLRVETRKTGRTATSQRVEVTQGDRAILDARLFPVAVELLSATLGHWMGTADSDAQSLLIRFAGNEKGVVFQLEQALVHLKNSGVKSSEVLTDDTELWQKLAAVPIEQAPSFATRVLPTQVAEKIRALDGGLWQAGIADGRIRVMSSQPPATSLDPLSQRVKQQLDPLNLMRGHSDEHRS